MKTSQGTVFKRREKILELFQHESTLYVNPLAKLFNVSEMTIRRDFLLFEKKKLIIRFYGGATLLNPENDHFYTGKIPTINSSVQEKIAQKALEMIHGNPTIYLNSGTTTAYLINYLTLLPVQIVTNNLSSFISINKKVIAEIILTGGNINGDRYSLIGDYAIQSFTKKAADICFIGVDGIDSEEVSSYSLSESLINRTILEYTMGPKVIICEGNKIGERNNFMISKVHLFTHLITDDSADQTILAELKLKGIKIILIK